MNTPKNSDAETRYTVEEIAEYIAGWASGPFEEVEESE
jgi:hypothetical protein